MPCAGALARWPLSTWPYYTDRASLEFILGGDDVDVEFRYMAQDAVGLLSRRP